MVSPYTLVSVTPVNFRPFLLVDRMEFRNIQQSVYNPGDQLNLTSKDYSGNQWQEAIGEGLAVA